MLFGAITILLVRSSSQARDLLASRASALIERGCKGFVLLAEDFDRFYGFLGGETNNRYPDLVEDSKFIDQPYTPEQDSHLSKDLADQAIRMLRNQKSTNPSKPWFMWFCSGANHAPHHSPTEYADRYKGKFDDGSRRIASGH